MSRRRPLNEGTLRSQVRTAPARERKSNAREENAPRSKPAPGAKIKKPSRRRGRAVMTFVAVAVAVLASVVTVGQWILRSSFLRVQHVTLIGVHHESSLRVLRSSGLEAHPSMFGLSATSIKQHLAQFPWIAGVTVTKHWPHSVVVTVREASSVAVAFNSHHVLQYVSASGHDLGIAPTAANQPTLQYLKPLSTTWPYERAGVSAAYVASQLPAAFSAQVALVTEDASGQVTLKMTTPVTFILGPATQLHAKFVAIASVIAHSTLQPGDVVDVTVPDELAVTGAPPL